MGTVTRWQDVARWQDGVGRVTRWQDGKMVWVEWQDGKMWQDSKRVWLEWQSGKMWQDGKMAWVEWPGHSTCVYLNSGLEGWGCANIFYEYWLSTLQKIWGMQFVVVLFKVLVEEIENLSWVRLKDFIENSSQLAEGKLLLEEHKVRLGNLPIFFFFFLPTSNLTTSQII